MQTQITNSLVWAEKQITLDCIKDFVPSVAERVSFAALQPVSGKTFAKKFLIIGFNPVSRLCNWMNTAQ